MYIYIFKLEKKVTKYDIYKFKFCLINKNILKQENILTNL